MANVIHIPTSILIMGLSLFWAVALGCLLAERMMLGNLMMVFAFMAGLCAASCPLAFRGASVAVFVRCARVHKQGWGDHNV